MAVIDLSSFKPVPDTSGDANQIANGFTALETVINGGIDRQNISAGVIGAATSSTVAGLGTAHGGDIALIRAGSSPFDFVHLIYDSTYSKWVSAPVRVGETFNKSQSSATYADALNSNDGAVRLPWKALNTAGLKWQFKWEAIVTTQASQSAFGIRLTAYTADYAGVQAQDTTNIFGEDTTFTVNATIARTSGWVDLNTSITVKDTLVVVPQIKSDGTRTAGIPSVPGAMTIWGRLVG